MMIMSHCGTSVVINVRLYDSQDKLKMGARKKTYPEFYIIYPYTSSDCGLRTALHVGPKCWLSWKVYELRQYRRIEEE